jgi:prevent-host-death family protein
MGVGAKVRAGPAAPVAKSLFQPAGERTRLSPVRFKEDFMSTVNIHAAKTHLSRLVEEAAAGREVIIAKAGKPLAKLVPLAATERPKRRLGILAGRARIPDDFDAPLPDEVLDAFEG